jgi:vancomycin resistance protein YoaR
MMVDAGLYSNKIHAGVSIAGQDMAGMTADEATAALTRVAEEARSKAITLTSDQKTWDVLPDSVGLEIDVAGSVSTAMNVTRESNVFVDMARKLKLYFSGQDIPLEGTLNSAEFDAIIDEVTEELDVPAVNAGFAIQGITLTEIEGQDGIVVDRDALREQLTETLLTLHSTEISIPMVVVEPEVKAEEYEAALAQTKTMIGAPLTLTSDEDSWTFSAGQVTGFVDFKSEESNDVSTLVPYISAKKMDKVLDRLEDLVATEPIDASFQGDDEKAWVVPAVPGAKLDREATTEALNAAALKSTGRTAEVVVKQVNAKFTTEEAEAMGIKDLLSVRTTEWTGTSNRRNNVRITTEFINADGKCYVAPGEEFSTAEAIGPRTPERGYKLAPGIQPNGALDDVFGGGICQVATTLFNAVFFAGLEVTERRNHTIYISHYPEGRDAAIAGDEVDLKFVNDTDHYIWIKGESTGFRTTFSIYGTDDGRRVTFKDSGILDEGPPPEVVTSLVRWLDPGATVVTSPGQPYRVVIVTRWITWPNGTKKEEKFTSIYPVRPMIILVGPATTTTTTLAPPPPTTSTT